MKTNKSIFLLLFFLKFSSFFIAQNCKEVIGYYPNWQWYDRSKLVNPSTIDYSKYSIINYCFFKPEASGMISSTDSWADENLLKGQINWSTTPTSYYPNTSIVDKAHNAGTKIMVSVGGWTLSDQFPSIAASASKRAVFAGECNRLLREYKFDGIDIDWEYPGFVEHSGTTADKQNFTIFIQQIKDSITAQGIRSNKTYKLSACFGASPAHAANIEWNLISTKLDMINLMTYDFFGTWDCKANHNSPLYAPSVGDANFNLDATFKLLTQTYNVPSTKINLGVGFYGRTQMGASTLYGSTNCTANTVLFSEDEGTPLYYNIQKNMNLFNELWDATAQVPYLLGKSGTSASGTFVSFDNKKSIGKKAEYIVNNNARGAIIWEITGDYLETFIGSGVIASTPLVDTLNLVFCNLSNVSTPTITNTISASRCGTGSVVLNASANTGTINWYTNLSGGSSIATGTTFNTPNLINTTTYYVESILNGIASSPRVAVVATINQIPATPTITASGPLTFCQGESVTLTSSSLTGNTWSTGATTQSINVVNGGNYTVTVTNAGCSAVSQVKSVLVNTVPATPIITANGPLTFCQGESVTLTSSAITGNTWSTGATTQSINVVNGGNYTVTVINAGCSAVSQVKSVIVNSVPATPTITANGPLTFCEGESVTLTSSVLTGNSWSTGATSQSIVVTTSGNYSVVVNNGGCNSLPSAKSIVVNPYPTVSLELSQDTICLDAQPLILSGGQPLGGEYSGTGVANNIFQPQIAGVGDFLIEYSVTENGCTASYSVGLEVKECDLSVGEITSDLNLQLFPNPTNTSFYIVNQLKIGSDMIIKDINGRKLRQQLITSNSSKIDMSEFESGIYIVEIQIENKVLTTKIVKL